MGTGYRDDILPLLVSLEDLQWKSLKLSNNASMLKYLPHTESSIYTDFGMSTNLSLPSNIGHQLQDEVAPALLFLLQGR